MLAYELRAERPATVRLSVRHLRLQRRRTLTGKQTFGIAGWTFAFEAAAPALLAALESDWRAFASTNPSGCVLRIEVSGKISRPAGWLPMLPAIYSEPDGALWLEGDGFRAEISADRRTGVVHQRSERFAIEAVVRVLLAESLFRRGGLLIHGVALAHGEKAAVFTGDSGAGKSTLGTWGARGGLSLLADELVAVLPEGDGFSVHGTPWNVGTPRHGRLAHLGVLAHAPEASLKPIEPSKVLRVLLSNVLEPSQSPGVRAELFQLAGKMLNAVPSYELQFAPNEAVAGVLREALT